MRLACVLLAFTASAMGMVTPTVDKEYLYRYDFEDNCNCELDCRKGHGIVYHVGKCEKIDDKWFKAERVEGRDRKYTIVKYSDNDCQEEIKTYHLTLGKCYVKHEIMYYSLVITKEQQIAIAEEYERVMRSLEDEEEEKEEEKKKEEDEKKEDEKKEEEEKKKEEEEEEKKKEEEEEEEKDDDDKGNGGELKCTSSEKSWEYRPSRSNDDCGPKCKDVRCKDTNVECGKYGKLTNERCGLIVDKDAECSIVVPLDQSVCEDGVHQQTDPL
eukprot:CFRG1213T1